MVVDSKEVLKIGVNSPGVGGAFKVPIVVVFSVGNCKAYKRSKDGMSRAGVDSRWRQEGSGEPRNVGRVGRFEVVIGTLSTKQRKGEAEEKEKL